MTEPPQPARVWPAAATPAPPRRDVVRRHSTADIVATSVLWGLLLIIGGGAVLAALLASAWTAMPICSDDCDSPGVVLFVHQALSGATIAVGGTVVAYALSLVGTAVAAVRRSVMWMWPALGLTILVVSFGMAAARWIEALPSST